MHAKAEQTRVWIYAAARPLSEKEIGYIEKALRDFCAQWKSHGRPVQATGYVLYQRFVVVEAEETDHSISGCAIDQTVRFVEQLGRQLHLNLLQRDFVFYEQDGIIESAPLDQVRQWVREGKWTAETYVFNTSLTRAVDLMHRFRLPLAQSFLARYLPRPVHE